MSPLILALLSQTQPSTMNLNQQPIMVRDEGVAQGTVRAISVNCTGAGVTCTQSGSTMTITVAGGGGAPTSATYITQTPDATLTNEQALNALATGLVVNTNGTGVLTIYTGTSCSNSFVRSLTGTGSATCNQVSLTADVTGILPAGNGGLGATQPTCAAGSFLQCNGTTCSCVAETTAYRTVEDEGTVLAQRSTVNFTGTGVSCTDSGGKTVCSITSGGGGGGNWVTDTVTFASGSFDATKAVTAAWASGTSTIVCQVTGEEASVEQISVVVVTKTSGSFTVRAATPFGAFSGSVPIVCTGV